MAIKITMITFRTAKTLGDIMGAYRVIQALCKTTSMKVKVDFIIYSENSDFAGLKEEDGSLILAAPHNNVEFKVHLINTKELAEEIGLSLSAVKYIAANFAVNSLSFFVNKIKIPSKFFGVEKVVGFLCKKIEEYEIENTRQSILKILSDQAGKYSAIRAGVMNADLLLAYSCPGLFLSLLQVYSGHKKMKLPKNAWFISEYNGGNTLYNEKVQQARSFPVPDGIQLKFINTGFPDPKTSNEIFGVFVDEKNQQPLTKKEQRLLNKLGYSETDIECQPGLFFGYVNHSTNYVFANRSTPGNIPATFNPKVELEFFAITAVKQYLTFHSKIIQEKINIDLNIDIVAPFKKEQCESITKKLRLEYPNMAFHFVSALEDGNLKVEPIDTHNPISRGVINVRLINIFPTSPGLFKRFLQISEPFTIQTGDQSVIEAMLRKHKKVPLYQVMTWKLNFYVNFLSFLYSAIPDTESLDCKIHVADFIQYSMSTLELGHQDAEVDEGLQGLTKLIINPDSFKHLSEAFQMASNKIRKELNAGDKLHVLLQESFPELTSSIIEEASNNSREQHLGALKPEILLHYQNQLNAQQERLPDAASSRMRIDSGDFKMPYQPMG